jgi:hypothetical protein
MKTAMNLRVPKDTNFFTSRATIIFSIQPLPQVSVTAKLYSHTLLFEYPWVLNYFTHCSRFVSGKSAKHFSEVWLKLRIIVSPFCRSLYSVHAQCTFGPHHQASAFYSVEKYHSRSLDAVHILHKQKSCTRRNQQSSDFISSAINTTWQLKSITM